MWSALSTLSMLALTTSTVTFTVPKLAIGIENSSTAVAQRFRTGQAEQICVDALEDEGYRVNRILEANHFSGGAEVILEAEGRRERLVVGCDYADNTGDVELYRLERYAYDRGDDDGYNNYPNNDSDDWQNRFYDSNGVRDDDDAEDIARAVVGDQLGIDDPYSDIVRIDDVSRESRDRNWLVEGRVNGAPFLVRIRADDAYVLDFELY
ncbi:MAG: hypothetical protein Kow00121_31330 [Elainellaceae cyanobacterium]